MTQAPRPPAPPAEPPLTPEEELALLNRKLMKRTDEPGFASNVKDIEGRIAEVQAAITPPPEPEPEPTPDPEPPTEPEPPPEP